MGSYLLLKHNQEWSLFLSVSEPSTVHRMLDERKTARIPFRGIAEGWDVEIGIDHLYMSSRNESSSIVICGGTVARKKGSVGDGLLRMGSLMRTDTGRVYVKSMVRLASETQGEKWIVLLKTFGKNDCVSNISPSEKTPASEFLRREAIRLVIDELKAMGLE